MKNFLIHLTLRKMQAEVMLRFARGHAIYLCHILGVDLIFYPPAWIARAAIQERIDNDLRRDNGTLSAELFPEARSREEAAILRLSYLNNLIDEFR